MKHILLLIAMAITCVLAAIANLIVSRMIGINIFTFKMWLVIPMGAIVLGMLGASGAILAARYFQVRPNMVDAAAMVVVAAVTMFLIYYLDYATLVLDDGRKVSDLIDFDKYVDFSLTKSHMRVGRAGVKTGEVGEMGYALAAIEFVGFLVGGAATFLLIKGLPSCTQCSAYLRKLKTKKTKELTFDEAGKLIDCFNRGDLRMVQDVIAWYPAERKFDANSERAIITFDLFGCPNCKTEAISVNVNAFNGKEWNDVPTLKSQRDLSEDSSLRDQFA